MTPIDLSWFTNKHSQALSSAQPLIQQTSKRSGLLKPSLIVAISATNEMISHLRSSGFKVETMHSSTALFRYKKHGSTDWTYVTRKTSIKGRDGTAFVKGVNADALATFHIR
jgi:hypothetical protein